MSRFSLTVAAALAAFALTPTAGAFNPQIAGLQIALRQHGLYRGPIDAVQGPKTVRAVRAFQRRHRLAVDAWLGRALERHWGLEGDRSSAPGSSGAAGVATTSACSSSSFGAVGCESARSTDASGLGPPPPCGGSSGEPG